jgi:hypothetical protein
MSERPGSAFALASTLRSLDDDELARLIAVREVRAAGITDFFVLAERLLDPANIQNALSPLDRRNLLTLAAVVERVDALERPVTLDEISLSIRAIDHPESFSFPSSLDVRMGRLQERALVRRIGDTFAPYDAVASVVLSWPGQGLPDLPALATPPPPRLGTPGAIDREATDARAAESGFTSSVAAVELVTELARDGARVLARGGIGVPDLKRLAAAAHVDPDAASLLLRLATRADLITFADGRWVPAPDAEGWMLAPIADRWGRLALGWNGALTEDMRFVLTDRTNVIWGEHFSEFLDWMYPAASAEMRERAESHLAAAELLGVLAGSAPSTPGSALLSEGVAAATAAMSRLLPPEVHTVYLQNDLSVIAPGPLAPALDRRLSAIADVESRGIATTYRVTAASLTRGLQYGEDKDSMLQFLESISTAPVPQPLRYLVTETANQFGTIRVGTITSAPSVGRVSYVRTSDPVLLETLLVDRRLSPLGLHREGDDAAASRFERDVVYLALLDARYPVAAENGDGQVVPVGRISIGREVAHHAPAGWRTPDVHELVARLREVDPEQADSELAWLERQLELAIRSKLRVVLRVAMPGGAEESYTLEPTGMSGGRVRARDRKADIERTFPLSRILEVNVADPA